MMMMMTMMMKHLHQIQERDENGILEDENLCNNCNNLLQA